MKTVTKLALLIGMLPATLFAHHGVASLGIAGLEGPGAPIETSSSAPLPVGSILGYLKLDSARFEKYTQARDGEMDRSAFWIYGAGYGVKPWLSLYLFAPFNVKKVEDNSYNTSGFADLSTTAVLCFKYDDGIRLVPAKESLDDLEDWHFTLYGGMTLPTGDENTRNREEEIDPGMSLGFGRSSYSLGFTSTRQISSRLTWVFDTSIFTFSENEYADGARVRFGDEFRINTALAARIWTKKRSGLRVDGNVEGNYLSLGRDETDGLGDEATGGRIFYAVPGIRFYFKKSSAGFGVKLPVWTDLNEEDKQQGAEGKESRRFVFTFTVLL